MDFSSNLKRPNILKLPPDLWPLLACPACRSALTVGPGECRCTGCPLAFPIVDGIPVLIDEARSVFTQDDFRNHGHTTFRERSWLRRMIDDHCFLLTHNYRARDNFRRLAQLLLERQDRPKVLVIGGSIPGAGFGELLECQQLQLVETDVAFGPRTSLICDAHDMPFADGTFDGVIIQAVLNCVPDPYRCVQEAHRVLKPDGLIYTETSFIQPVLDGRYDFTRFTHLGYLRLFRHFDQIDSGPVGGPGMALGLIYRSFLLSLAKGKFTRSGIGLFANVSACWLKYVDYFLLNRPAALDSTSGCYFLGSRSDGVLSDRQLIRLYRGAQRDIGEEVAAQPEG